METIGQHPPRRLLGVWAHPDDEAYLSAALMGRVVDHGGRVTVVTATLGEQGTGDPELAGTVAFARHRRQELRAALAEVGVTDLRVLGHADGACDEVDPGHPVAVIAALMRRLRPDAVVTFGPDGMTWHPDHQAVSSWTTEAWLRADRPGELLYAGMSEAYARRFDRFHREIGLFDDFGDGTAPVTPADRIVLDVAPSPRELARKGRVLARHASQTTGIRQMMGDDGYLEWVRDEVFRHPTADELARVGRLIDRTGAAA